MRRQQDEPPAYARSALGLEADQILIAVRSGVVMTAGGALLLAAAALLNGLGADDARVTINPTGWALIIAAIAGSLTNIVVTERRRAWIASLPSRAVYLYIWSWTMALSVALAAGVVMTPAATAQFSVLFLLQMIYAGYFYTGWMAISAVGFSVAALTVAVLMAAAPQTTVSPFMPSSVVPIIGTMLMAAGFVAYVRRSRDRLEERARIVAALGLAKALDVRDPHTANHSETVGAFAEAIARELGLPHDRVQRIRLAGMLHDIGKIGVPDAVLLKPGKLTDDEWTLMRRHPEIGAQMIDSTVLADVRSWVIAHHERPDGRGYPHGLHGSAIPLESRILAVADAYEAMIADRVYRNGMPEPDARDELQRCAGTQFDCTVVDALLAVLSARAASSPATPLTHEVDPSVAV